MDQPGDCAKSNVLTAKRPRIQVLAIQEHPQPLSPFGWHRVHPCHPSGKSNARSRFTFPIPDPDPGSLQYDCGWHQSPNPVSLSFESRPGNFFVLLEWKLLSQFSILSLRYSYRGIDHGMAVNPKQSRESNSGRLELSSHREVHRLQVPGHGT